MSARLGPERCDACQAPVSAHDRFCQSCGASRSGTDPQRFAAGPSFVDDEPLEIDPNGLPPWLRDIAQAAPQHSAPDFGGYDQVESIDEELPEWLREDRAEVSAAMPVDTLPVGELTREVPAQETTSSASEGTGFSLIGEDDLPEWLRALGEEEPAQPQAASRSAGEVRLAAPPTVVVPPVSRAWLARPRTVDPTAEDAARHEFVPLGGGAEVTAAQPQVEPVAASAMPVAQPAEVIAPAAGVDRRKQRLRIAILILAIIALALLVYIYLGTPGL